LFSGLAFGPFALKRVAAPARAQSAGDSAPIGLAVALAAGSLILFSMAVGAGGVALPIAITDEFAGSKLDVGLAFSVCALLEVPVMMAIAARPSHFLGFKGMAVGFIALAAYFCAAALAPSAGALVWAQALRAVGIGFVSCVGISYLQDLMPSRIGAASALYGNTGQIGQLLAGLAAGAWAQALGYHSLFWPCAVVSIAGLALLTAGRSRRSSGFSEQREESL
jgi:SET family sugar efflux transporter-like MFS transporter